jgi:nucleoside 2-deoxyribosyltransferase
MSECVASLQRHVEKFKLGDTSEDHLAAILFGGMALCHYEEEIKAGRLPVSIDDMPHYMDRGDALEVKVQAKLDEFNQGVHAAEDIPAGAPVKIGDRTFEGSIYDGPQTDYLRETQPAKPLTVYLCGPITGVTRDYDWRYEATQYLTNHGIRTLNPLRGKKPEYISNDGLSYKGQLASPEIADRDRMDIDEADVILAHFPYDPPRQSIGSLMEMGMAHAKGKPVILCTSLKTFNDHLFCRNFCVIMQDFDKALDYIIHQNWRK